VVTAAADRLGSGAELRVTYAFQEATVADPAARARWNGEGIAYAPLRTVSQDITAAPVSWTVDVGGNARRNRPTGRLPSNLCSWGAERKRLE
jgi:hypothetical protein